MNQTNEDIELDSEAFLDNGCQVILNPSSGVSGFQIPLWTRYVNVGQISPSLEYQIAIHLDSCSSGCEGFLVQNWKDLAFAFGLTRAEIDLMATRLTWPESPTCHLLLLRRDMLLHDLLCLVVHKMERLDILIEIQPALQEMGLLYCKGCFVNGSRNCYDNAKLLNGTHLTHASNLGCFEESTGKNTQSSSDSGFMNSNRSSSSSATDRATTSGVSAISQLATAPQTKVLFNLALGRNVGHNFCESLPGTSRGTLAAGLAGITTHTHTKHDSALASVPTSPVSSMNNGIQPSSLNAVPDNSRQLLITFVEDSDYHCKLINKLCFNLHKLGVGFGVQVIRLDKACLVDKPDLIGTVEKYFRQAAKIIVICSPGYRACVEGDIPENSAWTLEMGQVVRYMHRFMAAEYRDNNARNIRFRPVIFRDSELHDVPLILRNTIIHCWPRQHAELCSMLFDEYDVG